MFRWFFTLLGVAVAAESLPALADIVGPNRRPPPLSPWQPVAVAELIRKNGQACDAVSAFAVPPGPSPEDAQLAFDGYDVRIASCDNGKNYKVAIPIQQPSSRPVIVRSRW